MKHWLYHLVLLIVPCAANAQQIALDSLKVIWNDPQADPRSRLNAVNEVCRILAKDEEDAILNYARRQFEFAERIGDTLFQALALTRQGEVLMNRAQYPAALDCFERSLGLLVLLKNDGARADVLYGLGGISAKQGRLDEALAYYEASLAILEGLGDKRRIAKSLCAIGNLHFLKGEFGQALEKLLRGQSLCTEVNDGGCFAPFYNALANIYNAQGNSSQAIELYKQSIRVNDELHDSRSSATSMHNMAGVFFRLGDGGSAVDYWHRALTLRTKIGDMPGQASTLTGLGVMYNRQGEDELAIEFLSRALAIAESVNDKNSVARILSNLGIALDAHGEHAEAGDYYRRSLILYEEMGNRVMVAEVMSHLGTSLHDAGSIAEAIDYLTRSFTIRKELGDQQGMAESMVNLGIVHRRNKEYSEARKNFENALRVLKELGDTKGVARIMNNLSRLDAELGDYAEAEQFADSAIQLAQQMGSVSDVRDALQMRYRTSKQKEEFDVAYRMLIECNAITDSIFDFANQKAVVRQKLQYDFNAQHARDSLLQRSSIQQLTSKTEAERALASFRLNIQFIFAGVTSLVIAIGLVVWVFSHKRRQVRHARRAAHLQTQVWRSQVNPQFIHTALQNINDYVQANERDLASSFLTRFARLMRAVLENARKDEVSLASDLAVMRDYMELERIRTNDGFQYGFELDPAINAEEVMVPPMLLQPFAEEAIWKRLAHKDAIGHLTVRVKQQGNALVLSLEDDGREGAQHPDVVQPLNDIDGTSITRSRLDLLAEQERKPASVRVLPLAQGCRVELIVPLRTAA